MAAPRTRKPPAEAPDETETAPDAAAQPEEAAPETPAAPEPVKINESVTTGYR